MERRFSEMSEHEIRQEIANLNEKAKKAEQMGMVSEFAVYERKKVMAEAYLLNPQDYKPEERYNIKGEGGVFVISYMNGVFAWGYRDGNDELEALPISLLKTTD
ncbi:YfhH family protein [Thalassorhabdus alkalitolerans]|uniref:YfhH family protein n=1 Tax=Thalassorhabdus alkalitolerans TaxID=2282697 RepID=A0ABW0YPI1_9BACI|nr:YfhH family protein [Thalassobacillus sp. C254]